MIKTYRIRNYCRDCLNEDSLGCFNGDYSYVDTEDAYKILNKISDFVKDIRWKAYETNDIEELHVIGNSINDSCSLYEYQILDENDDIIYDSY